MSEAQARADWLRQTTGWPFSEGRWKRLGVAVSGGGDSMALLDLMAWHGADKGFSVHAVTVDHGLRPEAADEAALVAEYCAAQGVPHDVLHWTWDRQGNLQAAARDARYQLIARWARKHRISCVALGHTQDDVAETFLLRLSRASGVDGLAAMERRFERYGVNWLRPLLQRQRETWRTYLRDMGIAWAEDASNEDERFDRVKARKILAALEPLGIQAETLSRTSQNLKTAKHALEHYTLEEADRLVEQDQGDLILTRNPVPPVPSEIDRRLILAGLRWVSGADYPPRSSALAEMEAAFIDSDTFTLSGCVLTLSKPDGILNRRLRITREWNAVKDLVVPTNKVWDGRWQMTGPQALDLQVRALGEVGLRACPDWRDTGMPRVSLLASPSVWRGNELVAAPLAGLTNGWRAELVRRSADFPQSLISH